MQNPIFVGMAEHPSSEESYLITVLTVTYPHELLVARGRLEAESIPYFIQDELIGQVQPFYSNAMGGLRLKVRQEDVERATEILVEGGYISPEPVSDAGFLQPLMDWSAGIPILNKIPSFFRVLLILFIALALVMLTLYFILVPYEKNFARSLPYMDAPIPADIGQTAREKCLSYTESFLKENHDSFKVHQSLLLLADSFSNQIDTVSGKLIAEPRKQDNTAVLRQLFSAVDSFEIEIMSHLPIDKREEVDSFVGQEEFLRWFAKISLVEQISVLNKMQVDLYNLILVWDATITEK